MADERKIARAVVEAEADRSLANFVILETIAAGALLGFVTKSWPFGIGFSVVLLVVLQIPYVNVLVNLLISFAWSVGLGQVARAMGWPDQAVIATGIFGLVASLMAHFSYRSYMKGAREDSAAAHPLVEANKATAVLPAVSDDDKECPYCAETIKRKATKCRYCGSTLPQ